MKLIIEKHSVIFGCSLWLMVWISVNWAGLAVLSQLMLPGPH